MLKKFSKIGASLSLLFFGLYNTCFADAIYPGEVYNVKPAVQQPSIFGIVSIFVILGILGLIIIACTIAIIIAVLNSNKKKANAEVKE
ncbi:MAG: hypothetical protein J6M60_07480 [Clostridia bacterium]|nr:hypothetical protein [Clostridia bacterium]